MAAASEYDGEVQMYVEAEREVDLGYLRFLRWLAERGSLEHGPAGPSHGVYALADVVLAPAEATADAAPGGAPPGPERAERPE
jgi:hypothetical protein